MADMQELPVQTAKKASYIHDEDAFDGQPSLVIEEIAYERNGLKGIVNSPYVCGAALLASFGGLSFGYGKLLYSKFQAYYK